MPFLDEDPALAKKYAIEPHTPVGLVRIIDPPDEWPPERLKRVVPKLLADFLDSRGAGTKSLTVPGGRSGNGEA